MLVWSRGLINNDYITWNYTTHNCTEVRCHVVRINWRAAKLSYIMHSCAHVLITAIRMLCANGCHGHPGMCSGCPGIRSGYPCACPGQCSIQCTAHYLALNTWISRLCIRYIPRTFRLPGIHSLQKANHCNLFTTVFIVVFKCEWG